MTSRTNTEANTWEEVRESIKRTDRRRDLQRKRVKPSGVKEECGRCRKENIGNSISGGATSRTPEYISSSHREREGGRWREHGGGKAAMGIITRFICNILSPFPAVTTVSLPFFGVSPYSPDLFSVSLRRRSNEESNLLNLLCRAYRWFSLLFLSSHFISFY